jgi:hypothetical protein
MFPNVGRSVDQVKTTALGALPRKQPKAPRYGLTRPLWLFIELADRAGLRADRAFEDFIRDGFPPIAPYERVVAIYDGAALDVDDAGNVTRMNM